MAGQTRTPTACGGPCDGIRRMPWGTILVTEEDGRTGGDGHFAGAYEILGPLAFDEGKTRWHGSTVSWSIPTRT